MTSDSETFFHPSLSCSARCLVHICSFVKREDKWGETWNNPLFLGIYNMISASWYPDLLRKEHWPAVIQKGISTSACHHDHRVSLQMQRNEKKSWPRFPKIGAPEIKTRYKSSPPPPPRRLFGLLFTAIIVFVASSPIRKTMALERIVNQNLRAKSTATGQWWGGRGKKLFFGVVVFFSLKKKTTEKGFDAAFRDVRRTFTSMLWKSPLYAGQFRTFYRRGRYFIVVKMQSQTM